MSRFSTSVSIWFLAATILAGHAVAAQPQVAARLPAHNAFAQPPASGAACMSNRLVSHVAYLPANAAPSLPCGHLLSTDTVLNVHHWDKT